MLTACLPSDDAAAALAEHGGDLAGARVLVWDGAGEPPAGVAEARFLLGPYMGTPWPPEALGSLPGLEVVQLLSAGVDGWIDNVPAAVTLCNGRGVHGASTAEVVVLGILAWRRRLTRFLAEQAQGRWSDERRTPDCDGLRVTVLGAGDIASHVRDALAVFGAEVTMVGRTARGAIVGADALPELLTSTEALVVAVPLDDGTRHLVDAEMMAAVPDGAVIVNVSRGPVVDTDALVAEVRAGRLHCVLDVTDPEPLPEGHELWGLPQAIVLPHIGGGTDGWQRRGFALVGAQLRRLAAGEQPVNVVKRA